ncbi:signal peptidase II [Aureivirga sp. CE67]|uniref:signal peptidase II n=1 Tax=Aureivirga sp. CE67 TaxID=1788983 RepID=UPI0018CB50F9|nr:signal peptidase II [Aureivirga sp. CE67]
MSRKVKIIISFIVILCNVSCDQFTKEKARAEILNNETIHVFSDHFILTKVENTGAALSIGKDLSPIPKIIFLQIFPIVVLLLMFVYIISDNKISKLNLIGISFIIGGGFGNIYDRVLYNSVTDFMYIQFGSLHTGIFNMADVSVSIGTLLLLSNLIFIKIEQKSIEKTSF